MPEHIFKSRENFREFLSQEGKDELENVIGFNLQILSVSKESNEKQPDILALNNKGENTVIQCEINQANITLVNLLRYGIQYDLKTIIWVVNQETPEAIEPAGWLSGFLYPDLKLYIIKCFIEDEKICFKTLLCH